jgi:hypothetical protein
MPFDISFAGFVNFLLGMITGVVVFLGLFTALSYRGKHIDLTKIKRPENDMDEEQLKALIEDRQDKLKRMIKYDQDGAFKSTMDISYQLIEEVSRYFFPNSKYPMLELSVNELLELNHYITQRIDELLNIPVLKLAKKMRVIQIVNLYEKKRAVEQNKVLKLAKKAKIGKVLKYGSMAMNAVNPVYWFRKFVINTTIDAITKKVCVVIVGVVGEETAKIYSKKLFDKDLELGVVDKNMEDLLEEGIDENAENS